MEHRPWIKIDTNTSPAIFSCERCGKTRPVHLPASIKDFSKQAEAFAESHKLCKNNACSCHPHDRAYYGCRCGAGAMPKGVEIKTEIIGTWEEGAPEIMDIIKKLKQLAASWESRADNTNDNDYSSGTMECVNDLEDFIVYAQEHSVQVDANRKALYDAVLDTECDHYFNREGE